MKNNNPKNGRNARNLDWETTRQRISLAFETFSEDSETSSVMLERIWRQRAEQLAKAPVSEAHDEQLQLTLVRLRGEIYGLDVQFVTTIRPAQQITFVPRVPDWIVGVVNIRGEILSVVDLHRFFGLPEPEENPQTQEKQTYLVVIQTPQMELALRVDEILGVESISASQMQANFDSIQGIPQEYIAGVLKQKNQTQGSGKPLLVVVLNLFTIINSEQFIIHDEIV